MKHFLCIKIILCFCFCNCFAQTLDKDLYGVYFQTHMSKGYGNPIGNIVLEINKDGTYIYEDRIGWQLEYSKGYWNYDSQKKDLLLRGIIPSTDSIPIVVKEKNVEGVFFQILFKPAFNDTTQWSLVLNDREYLIIPDSILLIKNINSVDSFFIKGLLNVEYINPVPKQRFVRSVTYYPQKKYNSYEISFLDSIDYHIYNYVPLNDTLNFKGKNLVWNRKKWSKIVKLKKRD